MSGLLSLKWNNHSSVFLSLLQSLRIKELYCDTTIVCHGKYYPVHKLVLSTCSDYFEDIFEKTECKHPFIIMRDVEPSQLEALLNYMYKGEVNVLQESLPGLIKSAEALKIKGLAVPDDASPPKSKSTHREKKRVCNPSFDDHSPKMMRLENSENESHSDHNLAKSSRDNVLDSVTSPIEKDTPTSSQFEPNLNASSDADPNKSLDNGLPIYIKSEPSEALDESPEIQPKEEACTFDFTSLPNATVNSEGVKDTDFEIYSSLPVQESYQDLNLSWARGEPSTSNEQDLDEELDTVEMERSTSSDLEAQWISSLKRKKCPHCPFSSKWTNCIKLHIQRIHTTDKPFACSVCSYRCTTRNQLTVHNRKHTGERPYQCPYCPYSAIRGWNLNKHFLHIHGHNVNKKQL